MVGEILPIVSFSSQERVSRILSGQVRWKPSWSTFVVLSPFKREIRWSELSMKNDYLTWHKKPVSRSSQQRKYYIPTESLGIVKIKRVEILSILY